MEMNINFNRIFKNGDLQPDEFLQQIVDSAEGMKSESPPSISDIARNKIVNHLSEHLRSE